MFLWYVLRDSESKIHGRFVRLSPLDKYKRHTIEIDMEKSLFDLVVAGKK